MKKEDLFILPKELQLQLANAENCFFVECERLAYGNAYVIDKTRLEACKTPEERRALVRDPTAFIPQKGLHGLIK